MYNVRRVTMLVQIVFIFCVFSQITAEDHRPCHHGLTVNITSGLKLPNRTIIYENITYTPSNYYQINTTIHGCFCNIVKNCVRKCCPFGQTYIKNKCTNSTHSLATNLDLVVHKNNTQIQVPENHFNVFNSKYCGDGSFKLDARTYETDQYFLQNNGVLYLPNGKGDAPAYHQVQHYCFEHFEDQNFSTALVCFDGDVSTGEPEQNAIYSIGMMISMPFLLVTFLVYACVPELQNLHGKCLMCYVLTLFIAYCFLVSVQLTKIIPEVYCTTAPFIIYFSFLVSFLWLNVMCVDIWWTFSGLRGFKGNARQSEKRRFLVYSAYAWGVPLFMLVIIAILQFVQNLPSYIITPGFGTSKCWFPDDKTVFFYFYGPVLFVILSNICLFSYTTFKIWSVQRDTDRSMRQDNSQRHGDESDKQRYKLYLKLMLVFGLNWLMEIVSWAVTAPPWLWYVTDMCNAMYGVFIFFIFVCKANVWKLVKKRYHVFMGRPYLAKTYATASTTRSTGFTHSTNGAELQMNET